MMEPPLREEPLLPPWSRADDVLLDSGPHARFWLRGTAFRLTLTARRLIATPHGAR